MKHQITLLLFLALAAPTIGATPEPTPGKPAKPVHLPALRLFTDKNDCLYAHPYPSESSKGVVLLKNNKRWVDLKLKGTDKGGLYLGIEPKNLAPYLEKGALQFYIRGNKGGETFSALGFRMLDAKTHFNYATTLPLGDYCAATTKWQVVTIPLSEFPLTGKYIQVDEESRRRNKAMNQQISTSDQQLFQTRFNWEKVIEVQFEHNPSDEAELEVEISNVVILPTYKLKTVVREKEAIQ